MPLMLLIFFCKKFKMKEVMLILEVFMEVSLKIIHLKVFAITLELCIHNKMVQLKERKWLFKKWLRSCWMKMHYRNIFRLKPLITHVMSWIVFWLHPISIKLPISFWNIENPTLIFFFKVFGCKCFILNTKENLCKFDTKSEVGIFLGYSNSSKAYRVYNKRILVVEESMYITFDESNHSSMEEVVVNYVCSHPKELILGNLSRGAATRSSFSNTCEHAALISQIEPKSFSDAKNNEFFIMAMQE